MSEFSYQLIRAIGYPILWVSSRPVVLHIERVRRSGPFILAPNHLSPFDVAGLIGITPRNLDFLSITEFLKKPVVASFFRSMNCTFVDRGKADPGAAHALAARLRRGRAVAMFPEAGIRTEATSVINGGPFKPGVVRLAQLTGAPIVPCVILGTGVYTKVASYLPTRAVRWGLIYGNDIRVTGCDDDRAVRQAATDKLRDAYRDLYLELKTAIDAVQKK